MAKKTTKPLPQAAAATPELKPYIVTVTLAVRCAGHATAQFLASDIARAANETSYEFCEHVLEVDGVAQHIARVDGAMPVIGGRA